MGNIELSLRILIWRTSLLALFNVVIASFIIGYVSSCKNKKLLISIMRWF
jgi:hypothetical protein